MRSSRKRIAKRFAGVDIPRYGRHGGVYAISMLLTMSNFIYGQRNDGPFMKVTAFEGLALACGRVGAQVW